MAFIRIMNVKRIQYAYLKIEERFGNNTKVDNYDFSSTKNLIKDLKIYGEVL